MSPYSTLQLAPHPCQLPSCPQLLLLKEQNALLVYPCDEWPAKLIRREHRWALPGLRGRQRWLVATGPALVSAHPAQPLFLHVVPVPSPPICGAATWTCLSA